MFLPLLNPNSVQFLRLWTSASPGFPCNSQQNRPVEVEGDEVIHQQLPLGIEQDCKFRIGSGSQSQEEFGFVSVQVWDSTDHAVVLRESQTYCKPSVGGHIYCRFDIFGAICFCTSRRQTHNYSGLAPYFT